jgi:hypothetical protein
VLGLHGLRLRTEHIPVLIRIFSELRGQLRGLCLSMSDWEFGRFPGERFLLEAIGRIWSLRMLAFPDWLLFVGGQMDLVSAFASSRGCTVLIRGELSQLRLALVSVVAPKLTLMSVSFEDTLVPCRKRRLLSVTSPSK